jgi:gluconate 2-dehydrogenase gamma chain
MIMNFSQHSASDDLLMTRREAIRRTAMMLGVAVTPSLLTGVMQAQTSTGAGATRFLSAKQFATAAAIAERILPKTDTPGASDVGVPAFIDVMYGKYMTDEEKSVFVAGLAEVDATSMAMRQRSFPELSNPQQDALLTKIAAAAQDKEKTFFHLLKELTLLGYFSSEPIGRHVLHYDPIPGRFEGCIPLSAVGNKAWTR